MRGSIIIVALLFVPFVATVEGAAFCRRESGTYQNIHELLSAMDDVKNDQDKLAALFKVGDRRIQHLIQALNDSDAKVRLRAQIVIRYLGNPSGMKALVEWYGKQPNGYTIAGPVPAPLSEWDFRIVSVNALSKSPETWGDLEVQYVYALSIDDYRKSAEMLEQVIRRANNIGKSTFLGRAIQHVQAGQPRKLMQGHKDLAKLVLENAFFVSTEDQKHSTARLLALNGERNKALVEVYINRGRLAEEWYHVVITKQGPGWRFVSITPVAVS